MTDGYKFLLWNEYSNTEVVAIQAFEHSFEPYMTCSTKGHNLYSLAYTFDKL